MNSLRKNRKIAWTELNDWLEPHANPDSTQKYGLYCFPVFALLELIQIYSKIDINILWGNTTNLGTYSLNNLEIKVTLMQFSPWLPAGGPVSCYIYKTLGVKTQYTATQSYSLDI